MHCGDQRHLGLCLGYVPALAYGSCRVSGQGTTLRASDLHNARATILNPFNNKPIVKPIMWGLLSRVKWTLNAHFQLKWAFSKSSQEPTTRMIPVNVYISLKSKGSWHRQHLVVTLRGDEYDNPSVSYMYIYIYIYTYMPPAGIYIYRYRYIDTVYPKKYAHGFCFAVLCCGYTLTDFPISIRLTSLALWQSNDCPSASKATLMNMDK